MLRRTYRVAVGQAAIDPDAFNAFEARGWEDKAASYDRFVGDITGRFVEPLLNAVSAGPGTRLLDLATGRSVQLNVGGDSTIAVFETLRGRTLIDLDVANGRRGASGRARRIRDWSRRRGGDDRPR